MMNATQESHQLSGKIAESESNPCTDSSTERSRSSSEVMQDLIHAIRGLEDANLVAGRLIGHGILDDEYHSNLFMNEVYGCMRADLAQALGNLASKQRPRQGPVGNPPENTTPGCSVATTQRPAFLGLSGRPAYTPKPQDYTAFSLPEIRFNFDTDRLLDEAAEHMKTQTSDRLVNDLVAINQEIDEVLQKNRAAGLAGDETKYGSGDLLDAYAKMIGLAMIVQRFNSLDTTDRTTSADSIQQPDQPEEAGKELRRIAG